MYYFNSSIIDTDADAVVVPVNVDGVIKPGTLHYQIAAKLPEGYREEYFHNIHKGYLHAGEPDMYFPDMGPWEGRCVWNLPALPSVSTQVTLPHVMRGLERIMRFMKSEDRITMAIPHLCPGTMSWETMEYVLEEFEANEVVGTNVELWLYPEPGPEGVEEDEERMVLMKECKA